jgi:predicted Rossmann fold nucleotide-binding protein DprA/Smf involved in DNA uptake
MSLPTYMLGRTHKPKDEKPSVLEALKDGPLHVNAIAAKICRSVSWTQAELVTLRTRKLVERTGKGVYAVIKAEGGGG